MTSVTQRTDAKKGGPRTRLEAARWEAGYPGADGLARFARRMRRCPLYVRRIELHGRAPLNYAQEAQRHLRCHMNLFMWPDWQPVDVPPAQQQKQTGPTKAGLAELKTDVKSETDATNTVTNGRGGAPKPINARRLLAQEAANLAVK